MLVGIRNLRSMGQPRMLVGIRNLGSMGQPRMLVRIRNLRNLRNIGREHIVVIYQNSPSLISLISTIITTTQFLVRVVW